MTTAWSAIEVSLGSTLLRSPQQGELAALADLAVLPEAVLPTDQEHYVGWLTGRSDAERRAVVEAPFVEPAGAMVDAPFELRFVIVDAGQIVGRQRLVAGGYWPDKRGLYTASWLLRSHQGQGIGMRSRTAAVHVAFAYLGADRVRSHVLVENTASARICERLGYQLLTYKPADEDGRSLTEAVYELRRERWRPDPAVTVRRVSRTA